MDINKINSESALYIVNKLLEDGSISFNNATSLINSYTKNGPVLSVREQGGRTDSVSLNACMIESGIDVARIFNIIDAIGTKIENHQKINEGILGQIRLQNSKTSDSIVKLEKKIKNLNKFIYYETFRDKSGFATNADQYTHDIVSFDKNAEAIKLKNIVHNNCLAATNGSMLGSIKIGKQYCSSLKAISNNNVSIDKSIDPDTSTYWHECIITDTPITIEYKGEYSGNVTTNISAGAVCELVISLDAILDINEISLSILSEFPLDVLEIAYSTVSFNNMIPIVYKTIDNRSYNPINKYLSVKSSDRFIRYQFDSVRAKYLKIVINQRHYAPSNFTSSAVDVRSNSIFISENKEDFIDRLLRPIVDKIMLNKNINSVDGVIDNTNKIEYEYGLYNIGLFNNEYAASSQYISSDVYLPGKAQVALEANEEHYEDSGKRYTSIEYSIIENGIDIKNILLHNQTSVEWELLSPFYDADTNKMIATTRFDMDASLASNVILYKDGEESLLGYQILNNNTISFTKYDVSSSYCASYKVSEPDRYNTFTTSITRDLDNNIIDTKIQVSAILKRNSSSVTCVTPIIYDFTIIGLRIPLSTGMNNALSSIHIIPNELVIDGNNKTELITTDMPVLISVDINSGKEIRVSTDDILEVDEYLE